MTPALRPTAPNTLHLFRRDGQTFDGAGRIYSDAQIERAERAGRTISLRTAPAWLASPPKSC